MRGAYQRTQYMDQFVLDGESVVLYGNHYVCLGPLGTRIMKKAETPRTLNDLTTALADAFRVPAQGSAGAATHAAVAELVPQDVLMKADCD